MSFSKNFKNNSILLFFSLFLISFFFLISTMIAINTTNFSNDLAQATKDFVVLGIEDQLVFDNYDVIEIVHLVEVRLLYQKIKSTLLINLLILIFLGYFIKQNKVIYQANIKEFSKYFVLFVILICFILFLFYEQIFLLFHSFFFDFQWSFPLSSNLIKLFPYSFWLTKSIDVFILTLIFLFAYLIFLLIKTEPKLLMIREI